MVRDDFEGADFRELFRDPAMLESRATWSTAGFRLVERAGKIMVARHPSAQGVIFKKYGADVSLKDQRRNYERRVEGARRLRLFAGERGLRRVVVPRKKILELPVRERGERGCVLIVEQVDLRGDEQTKTAYRSIELPVLAELCIVLHRYRGMDSNAKNLPFAVDGRIAFVDTEHWDRDSRKGYLHQVGEYLTRDRRKLAEEIFRRLEDGDPVRPGLYDQTDFADEEDTSSSSSSSSSASSLSSS